MRFTANSYDLDVVRPGVGAAVPTNALLAALTRAIVVGPVARLELMREARAKATDNAALDTVIEAQISAQQCRDMAFREGETLLVTPRHAKVFLDQAAGI